MRIAGTYIILTGKGDGPAPWRRLGSALGRMGIHSALKAFRVRLACHFIVLRGSRRTEYCRQGKGEGKEVTLHLD